MNYCIFAERLRELRKGRGLTQKELGSQTGLSKAVVSKYETGMGYPSFDILIRIAQFFGVSTDYLLGASRNKTLDVSGLTEGQIHTIQLLITELSNANKK